MRAFREAVEAQDLDAAEALLAQDVVFSSPVVFKPYQGKAITAAILRNVVQVFEDFRYVAETSSADGRDHTLVFTARVGDRRIDGCDILHVGEDGLVDSLMVMVRPLSGVQALAEAMGARLDRIAGDAPSA
ncbi:nuclear transport factor 2 family protein [Streptomyces sp. NPDC051207]|uniref:nuclear transport factor 2 family protein n=1 Tax=Streptomyces sp. NPDC051207 TaxID=3154641 RepID=UPI0034244646